MMKSLITMLALVATLTACSGGSDSPASKSTNDTSIDGSNPDSGDGGTDTKPGHNDDGADQVQIPNSKELDISSITNNLFYSARAVNFSNGDKSESMETEAPNQGVVKKRYSFYFVNNQRTTAELADANGEFCEFYFDTIYVQSMIPKWEKDTELELGTVRQSWVNGQIAFELMLKAPKQPFAWLRCVNVANAEEMQAHVGKHLNIILKEPGGVTNPNNPKPVKTIGVFDNQLNFSFSEKDEFYALNAMIHVDDLTMSKTGLRNLYWRLCGEQVCITKWHQAIGETAKPFYPLYALGDTIVDKAAVKSIKKNMKYLRLEISVDNLVNNAPMVSHVSNISEYCTSHPQNFKNLDTQTYGCIEPSEFDVFNPMPTFKEIYFDVGTVDISFSQKNNILSLKGIISKKGGYDVEKNILSLPNERICVKNECSDWKFSVLLHSAEENKPIDYFLVLLDAAFEKKAIENLKDTRIEFSVPIKQGQEGTPTHFIDIGKYCDQQAASITNIDGKSKGCNL